MIFAAGMFWKCMPAIVQRSGVVVVVVVVVVAPMKPEVQFPKDTVTVPDSKSQAFWPVLSSVI